MSEKNVFATHLNITTCHILIFNGSVENVNMAVKIFA